MEVSGKRVKTTAGSTTEEIWKLCELCETDQAKITANGKCRECEEYMCLTCFRHHLKAKSCRRHVLIETSQSTPLMHEKATNVEKCSIHANELIKFYCRKHEIVGCGECMIPEHVACQPENIKDLSSGFQRNEDFKSLMRKVETIIFTNKENGKKVQGCQKENDNLLKKALMEIKTFRTELNNYLDRAESSVIKQAKDIERKNDKLLAKLEQDCTLLSAKITEMRQKLDAEIYQESALFIQTVDYKPRILDIEREISRIKTQANIRTFEFLHDKQLQDIIISTEKLGSLSIKESQSSTLPDTARRTSKVDRETFTGHLKQTEPVKEKRGKAEPVPVATKTPSHDFHPRLCHIRKWSDVQGYGFNLYEEKGRNGQFIGMIDANSPAKDADLRKGDRIIEVNGENIEDVNHQQVIQKIKAGGNETKLLVVDSVADEFYRNNGIRITAELDEVIASETRENDVPGKEQAKVISIGARVRPIGRCLRYLGEAHKGQPGTVTAVNSDDTVNVKWDATSATGLSYTMGFHIEPM